MRELFPDGWKPRIERFLLDLDSRIDFAVYQLLAWTREYYERFSTFMDRFHVSGWRRWLNEATSEAATLGLGGLIVMPMSRMKPCWVSSSHPSSTMVSGSARNVFETKPPRVA